MSEKRFREIIKEKPSLLNGMVFPEKKPKYKSVKVRVDGIPFDSMKEANYYSELKIRKRIGEIVGFALQPRFILQDGEGTSIEYRADFIEFYPDGKYKVVDTKGMKTEVFKLKEKLFKNTFPSIELILI